MVLTTYAGVHMTMAARANDIMYATKGRWANCQMCDKLPTYRDLLSGDYY